MLRRFLFSVLLSLVCTYWAQAQGVMDINVKTNHGDSLRLASLGGKRMMIIVLPVSPDTAFLNSFSTFATRYGDSTFIVGLFSLEDGYTSTMSTSLSSLYSNIPVFLLEGMYTSSENVRHHQALIRWLTSSALNRHSSQPIAGPGTKFFFDRTARLYAVLPAAVQLGTPVIEKVMRANPFPAISND